MMMMMITALYISAYICLSVVDKDNRIMASDVRCGVWHME